MLETGGHRVQHAGKVLSKMVSRIQVEGFSYTLNGLNLRQSGFPAAVSCQRDEDLAAECAFLILYMSGKARFISSAVSSAVPIWINRPVPIPGQYRDVATQADGRSTNSGQNGNSRH